MRNRFKIMLSIILFLIIVFVVILISLSFKSSNNNIEHKTLDKIKNYNYNLKERDSEVMKASFDNLKETLNESKINYEKYAQYLSELFIIDLFTLNNKDNKYDVGGKEYVLPDILDNYILNVEETLYKYIVDRNSEDREELLVVKSVTNKNIENTKYTYNNVEYDGYKVYLSWDYVKDLGYPKNGELILIKKNKKLYVVSYKGVE